MLEGFQSFEWRQLWRTYKNAKDDVMRPRWEGVQLEKYYANATKNCYNKND